MQKENWLYYVAMALVLAGPASLLAQRTTSGHLRAGAAKVNITPKESALPIRTDSIRDHPSGTLLPNGLAKGIFNKALSYKESG